MDEEDTFSSASEGVAPKLWRLEPLVIMPPSALDNLGRE
jgi:hypothetical protein